MNTQPKEIFETMDYGTSIESTEKAQSWLTEHKHKFGHFINGQWVQPHSGTYFKTSNPATSEFLADVAQGCDKDINDAVKSAHKAFPEWQKIGGYNRAKYLYALARLIQKNTKLISVIETMDNGKPIRESRDIDVPIAARHFYHHAGWAQNLAEEFPNYIAQGVVGQIIPWNFPFLMLAWKIAPALAAGNTIVLKPADLTPLSASLFVELCIEAGIPNGVVNIVQGDGKTGEALVKHTAVNKIAFTGSTDVGRIIRKQTAGTGKALTLELGGKSPAIIFEDADLDAAVEGIVDGIWFNQGQVCCATSRLLAQESIAPKLIEKLKKRMETIYIGNPLDKSIDMGCLISKKQKDRVSSLVNESVKEGADLFQAKQNPKLQDDTFYPPTLLENVYPASSISQTEVFGPVIGVTTFRTIDEAVQIANNSRYGLAASIWSENINQALDVAPKLKAGVIWINSSNLFDASCGFGGYKESGFGREGGREGMYAYLKPAYYNDLEIYAPSKNIKTDKTKAKSIAGMDQIDRTAKMYIGGKQTRPDSGYTLSVSNNTGALIGQVGDGNAKDIRNAVEAASKAESWAKSPTHLRAQILFFIAENLSIRADEFAKRLSIMTGEPIKENALEVEKSIERLFYYAGWCDKFDGAVHTPPMNAITVAMNESIGNIGIICPDEQPLLSFISLIAPVIAMGNRAIVIPSKLYPLIATDFYQVLETSDLPAGVLNIITGTTDALTKTLATHNNLDAVWYFGSDIKGSTQVEELSIDNLKQTWVNNGLKRDWLNPIHAQGTEFLKHATQIKNIWIPYGE